METPQALLGTVRTTNQEAILELLTSQSDRADAICKLAGAQVMLRSVTSPLEILDRRDLAAVMDFLVDESEEDAR